MHLSLACQCVELQDDGLRSLGRLGGDLEIKALLLSTVQQSSAQIWLMDQQIEEVGC